MESGDSVSCFVFAVFLVLFPFFPLWGFLGGGSKCTGGKRRESTADAYGMDVSPMDRGVDCSCRNIRLSVGNESHGGGGLLYEHFEMVDYER